MKRFLARNSLLWFSRLLPLLISVVATEIALATPSPGLGSAPMAVSVKNTAISDLGFRIGTLEEFWKLTSPLENKNQKSFRFDATAKENIGASFSVNVDVLGKPLGLNQYAQKWLKEYHYLGFEQLASTIVDLNNQKVLLIDLVHRAKQKQIRQFVIENANQSRAVIMTCIDQPNRFKQTVEHCHELLRNFQWTDLKPSLATAAATSVPRLK